MMPEYMYMTSKPTQPRPPNQKKRCVNSDDFLLKAAKGDFGASPTEYPKYKTLQLSHSSKQKLMYGGDQSSVRSTVATAPALILARFWRLSDSLVMVISPSSLSSSLLSPSLSVIERSRVRFSRLISRLTRAAEARSVRRSRFCSRSSSGVSSSGSRSVSGTGDGRRSMIPSISRSPVPSVSTDPEVCLGT